MPTDIVIPQLGESITEAVIASWLVEDGQYVDRDQEIVELETDKVTMPLPSPAAGKISFGVQVDDTVEVGASVGTIDESAKTPAGPSKPKADAPKAADPEPAKAEAPKPTPAPSPEKQQPEPATPAASSGTVIATPVARKLAEERGLSLDRITGTGPGGKVRERDVIAALQAAPSNGSSQQGSAPAPQSNERTVTRKRMSQLRKSIANRLVEAQQTAAMLTTFNECDMTSVMALRSAHKDAFLKEHGVKLGFMSFFVKAACSALENVPSVNSYIVDGDKGMESQSHSYCDVAIAVGTDKGLVVPVLRDAQSKSFAEIESGIIELATKAREGSLSLDDMSGGTFTITNGGIYGSMLSTPILNPPQSGILGMHNIIKRPIEHPGKPGEVAIRPMMYLALSYDHRIVDGEGAVTFLKHIKECIETPERLMLGV